MFGDNLVINFVTSYTPLIDFLSIFSDSIQDFAQKCHILLITSSCLRKIAGGASYQFGASFDNFGQIELQQIVDSVKTKTWSLE